MNHGLIARDLATGKRIGISWRDGLISEVVRLPGTPSVLDPWVSPGWLDIQTNGRWGTSFSDPDLTADQVGRIVVASAAMAAVIAAVRPIVGSSAMVRLLVATPVGLAVYVTGTAILAVDGSREVLAHVRSRLARR